jgi:nucleolin
MGEKKEKKEKKEKRERDVQEEGGGKKAKVENEIEIENAAAADDDDYAPSMKFKAADGRDKGTSETVHPAPGTFPTSGTKVYMGNLAWSIDEAAVAEAFADCGEVLSIKWFEEKETKKFLGAGVVEFDSSEAAQRAVAAQGRQVHNRETKIRPWEERGNTGEERRAAKAAKFEVKPMGPKPPGCYTLFMGNLNFAIDDDEMYKFFKEGCGAEMVAVRWLTNKETGEFRGVGFADFADDENLDRAATMNGKPCMGRGVRMDWQAPK